MTHGNCLMRSTHCKEFHHIKLCRPAYFVRTTQMHWYSSPPPSAVNKSFFYNICFHVFYFLYFFLVKKYWSQKNITIVWTIFSFVCSPKMNILCRILKSNFHVFINTFISRELYKENSYICIFWMKQIICRILVILSSFCLFFRRYYQNSTCCLFCGFLRVNKISF